MTHVLTERFNDKYGAVATKVGDVANIVTGTFKRMLGISSPSKVFSEYGENVVEVLVGGISGNAGRLRPAMSNIAAVLGEGRARGSVVVPGP
jgi:hypothetical protein